MPENPKQNEGIQSKRDAGEPGTKRKDQIRVQFRITRNKTKGSNPGAVPENPKQNEGIEYIQRHKERAMPQSKVSIPCQKPTITHKVKVTKLKILQTFVPEEKPSSLIHNIQYPPKTDRGYAPECTSKAQISR